MTIFKGQASIRQNFGQSLMTIFMDSHHFSGTLGSLWWQSLKDRHQFGRTLGSLWWQSLWTAITSAELWAVFDDNLRRQSLMTTLFSKEPFAAAFGNNIIFYPPPFLDSILCSFYKGYETGLEKPAPPPLNSQTFMGFNKPIGGALPEKVLKRCRGPKRKQSYSKPSIFRCYVSFREGNGHFSGGVLVILGNRMGNLESFRIM